MLCVSEGVFLAIYKLLISYTVSTKINCESISSKLYPNSAGILKASMIRVNPDLYNCIRKSGNMLCDRFDHVISSGWGGPLSAKNPQDFICKHPLHR